MRVFVAGATGVIGHQLVPLLISAGHEVAGMTRSETNVRGLLSQGALPVVCDVFDYETLETAMVSFDPDMVIHQLTDLPNEVDLVLEFTTRNNRIRTEGTRNLLAAASKADAVRFLAQSIAWTPPGGGSAIAEHESLVLRAGGVVLRYGQFYGPGTYFQSGEIPPSPRIHIHDAARRTLAAFDAPTGILMLAEEDAPDPSRG